MPDILTPSKETKLNAATTGPLRILGRANSFNVRKVLWVCDEIGVAYTREDFGRGFAPTNTADFLRLNLTGQVPVVIDADHPSPQSKPAAPSLPPNHNPLPLSPENPPGRHPTHH